jgi:5-methylthioadenosine/S-adenosylhomocysteine deaminase
MSVSPLAVSATAIEARWVLPVEPDGSLLADHTILVADGVIEDVVPTPEARVRFPAAERVLLPDHLVIPGLVNLHTHAAMTLLRGLADDLPLMDWLREHIWPAEIKHASEQFVLDGTLIACAEMIRGGITCFNDMYFFPEAAARAALQAGMRAAIGIIVIDFPTAYASDPHDYLAKGLGTRDAFKHEGLLTFCMAPHAPYTVSDRSLTQVLTLAEQLDVPIHLHLHETEDEIAQERSRHGLRPLQRLQALGMLSPNLIAVHAIHVEDAEIQMLASHGCHVAHCPSSNLKLASGFAPVARYLEAGVNVGLGTDGAASNNRLDLLEEMRLASLLAKAVSRRADVLPSHTAVRMATLNGAVALGLERRIGSIVRGKEADLVAVNLSTLPMSPCFDPVSHLVYCASRQDVSDVWIGGRRVLQSGHLTTLDEHELLSRALRWQERLKEQ